MFFSAVEAQLKPLIWPRDQNQIKDTNQLLIKSAIDNMGPKLRSPQWQGCSFERPQTPAAGFHTENLDVVTTVLP